MDEILNALWDGHTDYPSYCPECAGYPCIFSTIKDMYEKGRIELRAAKIMLLANTMAGMKMEEQHGLPKQIISQAAIENINKVFGGVKGIITEEILRQKLGKKQELRELSLAEAFASVGKN